MKDRDLEKKLDSVQSRLYESQRVVVLTGAGISAESGMPTFRGKDGLWRRYRAEELATPEAFARDSKLVWEFYNWRRTLLQPLRPNPAHLALAQLERQIPQFTLITQNIDDLHRLAGSKNILELHGNIWRVRCTKCGKITEDRRVPLPELPLCSECQGLLRPDVVWFGESLDPEILRKAYQALDSCQMMLVIGTSGIVQPAASMGLHAKQAGAYVVEINLEPTPNSRFFDVSLLGKAGELVPRLVKSAENL